MKPRLPREVALQLPAEVVRYIYQYVPHLPKEVSPKVSPSLEKELQKIQSIQLRGVSPMYLKDLEDFCLD